MTKYVVGFVLAVLLAAGFWAWVAIATLWALARKGRRP